MKKSKNKDCSRCNRKKGEIFTCLKRRYVFDVTKARKIVADGRAPIELEPEDVDYSIGRCEINSATSRMSIQVFRGLSLISTIPMRMASLCMAIG